MANLFGLPRTAERRFHRYFSDNVTSLSVIGKLFLVLSCILTLGYLLFYQQVFHFAELNLTRDHQLTPNGKRELTTLFYLGTFALFGLGYILLKARSALWRADIRRIFLDEPLLPDMAFRPSHMTRIILSTFSGMFLFGLMRFAERNPASGLYNLLYAVDQGILDLFVPITMAIAMCMLCIVAWKMKSYLFVSKAHVFLGLTILALIALLFVYVGEEISWGQDFFLWDTPVVFAGNVEGQTNIHNYFNAYFDYGYISLVAVPVIVCIGIWMERAQRGIPLNRWLLPHPSQLALSLLIGIVALVWFQQQELLEEMMACFMFFYSYRLLSCVRSTTPERLSQMLMIFDGQNRYTK